MHLTDAVIVVTGGGSGIGAAMCRRFAQEAPSAIVVADLIGEAAEAVAHLLRAEHGATTVIDAATCDVAVATQVRDLVEGTIDRHGRIDLFCANAGIATGAGIDASDDAWQRTWEVNVMAHVHAARALLPGWLARGNGHLLTTASAAGLLTNLGDAPYSVTKHAAVAFAEWMSITYGDRGVGVSCLCPQGVRTPMLFPELAGADTAGAYPDAEDAAALIAAEAVRAHGVIEPAEVADAVVAGLAEDHFLILPHPEVAGYERNRAGDRERWLRGMRRLQSQLGG
jgi:NAD(P)-dependent dehydrogenase (short-subunit alcohol dehydrogenase family)